jgi:hypothetical protein
MSQAATTTDRFKSLFRGYPNSIDGIYPNGQPPDTQIQKQTISYEELFCEFHHRTLFSAKW